MLGLLAIWLIISERGYHCLQNNIPNETHIESKTAKQHHTSFSGTKRRNRTYSAPQPPC